MNLDPKPRVYEDALEAELPQCDAFTVTVVKQLEKLIEDKERFGNRVTKHGRAVDCGIEKSEPLIRKDKIEGAFGLNGSKEVS